MFDSRIILRGLEEDSMKKSAALSLTLLLLLAGACVIAVVDYGDPGGLPPAEEYQKSFYFAPGGTLSLENINGLIEIQGWEQDEMDIFAEKMLPYLPARGVRWLRRGAILPKIDLDRFEDLVRIQTIAAGDSQTSEVNYYITVPQAINLKKITAVTGSILIADLYGKAYVELDRGDIRVENFSGSLDVHVQEGSIQASLFDIRSEDVININTQQGDITVYLEPSVQARLTGSAPGGKVYSEFKTEDEIPSEKLSTQLGDKGASVTLSTLAGNITIKKVSE